MQRNGTGAVGTDECVPLGEENFVRGERQFTELAVLDISIGNGTLTVENGELEPGEVRLSWVVKSSGSLGMKSDPHDMEIVSTVDNGMLAVTDEYHGPKFANHLNVEMVATVAKDIEVAASLGNGELLVDAARLKAADCGNGNVNLTGELVGDTDINVGNGKLVANLLIRKGNHGLCVGNGTIKLEAQEGSSFGFTADTGIGSIKVSGANAKETGRDWGFVGGEAEGQVGNSGGGEVELSVGNGSIKINAE